MPLDSVDVPPLLGPSAALRRVRAFVERVASVDAPVLIEGETGTGKGHVARLLHAGGARGAGPFVALNCAGVPETLFESELFGHTRGAFTGAQQAREGLMVSADGGTLFLDEIGELPPAQQAKLLVAVEERAVRPLGATRMTPVDFRLVSATCRVLATELEHGRFRSDLYHRIALLKVTLPALRERPEDILPLARRFLGRAIMRHRRGERGLTSDARRVLEEHAWPGNVRELAHVIEAAVILGAGPRIDGSLVGAVLAGEMRPAP
jgi:two-component system, NtrC family, response regulator HydG